MLGRLREKLRLIRYYSARRSDAASERAAVAGIVAATLLAYPLALVLHLSVVRVDDPIEVEGCLWPQADGSTFATVEDPRELGRHAMSVSVFTVTAQRKVLGWPWTTGTVHHDMKLDIRNAETGFWLFGARLAPDDPTRTAITAALLASEHGDLGRSLADPEHRGSDAGGWFVNVVLAWFILMFALTMLLRTGVLVGRVVTGYAVASRRVRLRSGLCADCGYDLSGSVYAERCPECGALLA